MKRIFWHIIAWFKSLFGAKKAKPKPMSVSMNDADLSYDYADYMHHLVRAQAKRERRKQRNLRNAGLL